MATVGLGKNGKKKSVSRRDFLRVGSLSVVGLSVAEQAARAREKERGGRRSCIFILMTGGPSQFETFDPKPDAPNYIRGPLKAIATKTPGMILSESLPQLAQRSDKFALIRSLTHNAAPIHETGLQLLQTGRLAKGDLRYPSYGSVVSRTLGPRDEVAPYVLLPKGLGNTGVNIYQGQQAGYLGKPFEPLSPIDFAGEVESKTDSELSASLEALVDEPESVKRMYGETHFGRLCLQARSLVERGVRCVTVNLFNSLAHQVTWDCHGHGPTSPANLYDYRDTLCPQFDRAVSALLDDLQQRGLLEETLVIATGEFGRTGRINEGGGRDHWPGVWSALVSGGGVQGGNVIGASDQYGQSPADRPVNPAELTATIFQNFGLELGMALKTEEGQEQSLADCKPVSELYG